MKSFTAKTAKPDKVIAELLQGDGAVRITGLFSPDQTGGDVTLRPASQADMRGAAYLPKVSLEVVYDTV